MNKLKLFIIWGLMLILTINANAATSDSPVGKNLGVGLCTSDYQDKSFSTSTNAYFSHCMEAKCKNRTYNINYYSKTDKVICSNGNTTPYVRVAKDGCSTYKETLCNNNDIKYCSMLLHYDCTKKSDGSSFVVTTKKTVKPTKRPTTTTTAAPKDSRLMSLSLSNGNFSFNPDIYEYAVTVENNVSSIIVNAVAMDSTSQITVSGNENIFNGSVINVTVSTTDGNISTYNINVTKEVVLSSNTKLKSLTIDNYPIALNSRTTGYEVTIDSEVKSLIINYEVQDEKSVVNITGNENLSNGSRIIINVTAEDGSIGEYTIDVFVKEKSNTLTILFVIIIVLALGAGGFYVYKKFFAGKSGEKYDYE